MFQLKKNPATSNSSEGDLRLSTRMVHFHRYLMLWYAELKKGYDNVSDLLDLGVFVVDLNSHSNLCPTFSSSMSKTTEI